MEIRILRYFLEIARQGSMTAAAEVLHVSQSALSKQMKELELALGQKLFRRGSRSVSLTDAGLLLRRRAEDILELVDKTTDEFAAMGELLGGDVYLGCAESPQMAHIARVIGAFQRQYPLFRFHIVSGDRTVVLDRLDRGLLDFGVVVEMPDSERYQYLELPGTDTWGILLRSDHPLAKKDAICAEDLFDQPLLCAEQAAETDIPRWCGRKADKLRITGTSNLAYNGSIFVREGLGVMLCLDRLISQGTDTELTFRPLEPRMESHLYLIWKKYQVFSPIAQKLLEAFLGA